MKKQKILALVLITTLFSFVTVSAEVNPLADGVDLWDVEYNSDGSASAWDVSAEENNLSVWDDISVTDEESRVWDMTAEWAEYTPTPEDWNTTSSEWSMDSDPFAASTTSDTESTPVVTSTTWNWNVDELPKTGPEELFILLFAFLLAGLIFSKRLKNV